MPSHQKSPSPEPVELNPVYKFATSALDVLWYKVDWEEIDPGDWKGFGITCDSLDLS